MTALQGSVPGRPTERAVPRPGFPGPSVCCFSVTSGGRYLGDTSKLSPLHFAPVRCDIDESNRQWSVMASLVADYGVMFPI